MNKIESRTVFKIKTGCKLELLTPEIMNVLGSIKKVIDQDKNEENIPKLESVDVVLVHCNQVKNDYQKTSFSFTFVPNKQFGQLINISPYSLIMMNTVYTEFSYVEVRFTNQVSKALEIEDNIDFDANYWLDIIQMRYSTGSKFIKNVKRYDFLLFCRKFGDICG